VGRELVWAELHAVPQDSGCFIDPVHLQQRTGEIGGGIAEVPVNLGVRDRQGHARVRQTIVRGFTARLVVDERHAVEATLLVAAFVVSGRVSVRAMIPRKLG
jgi:hypothetical protein